MTPDPNVEQPADNRSSGSVRRSGLIGRVSDRRCRRVQSFLLAYLDGDLQDRTRLGVARHLEGCAACRHELRLLAQSEQVLTASARALAAPGDLRAGFYARLAAAPRPVSRWRIAAPTFAVCGLLLLVSGTVYRLRESSSNVASVLASQSDSNARVVAGVTPPVASGRLYGMSTDANAKSLPKIALRPHSELARSGMPGQPAPSTPRQPQTASPARFPRIASLSAKRRSAMTGTARDRRYAHSGRLIAAGEHSIALRHSAFALTANANPNRKRNMQVALATYSERDDASLSQRGTFGRADSPHYTYANNTLSQEALNSKPAPAREPQTGAFGDNNGIDTSLANGESAAPAPVFRYTGDEENEADGVRFQVKDAQRGFTAATRSESRMQRQNGRQVLSVHLEDQDASSADAPEQAQPEQPKIETEKIQAEKIQTEAKPKTGTEK